jgi:N-acetylmuramoyl-L-alanine amidase
LRTAAFSVIAVVLVLVCGPHAQGTAPASPLTLVTREGRRAVASTILNGQEFIGLDDLAALFMLTAREDALAGGVTVTYKGRTVVASTDQPMASINGRVVTLPAPIARAGRRLLVPLDFIPRAIVPIYDAPIELRRASRLLIVGNVRVPRVAIRLEAAGPPTRLTIDVVPPLVVNTTSDAGRVLVRVDADALDIATTPAGAGLIDQIRTGDQTTTVTIALNARAGTPRISTVTTNESARVLVEVPLAAQQETAAPPPTPPPASAPAPVPAPPETPAPLLGTRTARLQTMVVDAGHGGEDNGARGPKGTLEKQITLEAARKLKTLVESRLGVRVVMTREEDRALSLDERDAIANNSKADLFLSIHANSSPSPSVKGTEVYYLRLDRAGEEARRNAAATELILPVVGGVMRPIDIIPWDLAQASHVDASSRFASMLEEELEKRVPAGPRPLQQAPMRVLSGANMPAALVEMAYLTNGEQEQRLKSADFQGAIVEAIYGAVVRFKSYLEAAPTP